MASAVLDVHVQRVLQDLNKCSITRDDTYLEIVSGFVFEHKFKDVPLKNPPNAVWKIMGLDDTLYKDKPDEVNGWNKFYLPNIVNMEVLGDVKCNATCQGDELVLMTCQDKNVYAYDGEELHLVASSLQDLINEGMEYPASRSYYKGEAFKDMTEEDWAKVKEGAVWKDFKKDHLKLAKSKKSTFLENLKSQK